MEHDVHGNTLELSRRPRRALHRRAARAVYTLLGTVPGDVVVDIAAVESIDLTTLKMLAVANRAAEREGRRVVLRGGSPGVRRLLHLSHLRWMIPVEPAELRRARRARTSPPGCDPSRSVRHSNKPYPPVASGLPSAP